MSTKQRLDQVYLIQGDPGGDPLFPEVEVLWIRWITLFWQNT